MSLFILRCTIYIYTAITYFFFSSIHLDEERVPKHRGNPQHVMVNNEGEGSRMGPSLQSTPDPSHTMVSEVGGEMAAPATITGGGGGSRIAQPTPGSSQTTSSHPGKKNV